MKIYCRECGAPSEYASKKPNFCAGCGYNFITKVKASSSEGLPKATQSPNQNQENLDEDSEEYDVKEIDPRVYEMTGLDVDIQITEAKPLTLGDMFPGANEESQNK